MLHESRKSGEWFAPKRFGYGAGVPIAWQGWVVLLAYVGVVVGLVQFVRAGGTTALLAGVGIILATAGLWLVAQRHTRGGWRWRWGERD